MFAGCEVSVARQTCTISVLTALTRAIISCDWSVATSERSNAGSVALR